MLRRPLQLEIGGDFETVSPELLVTEPALPPWEARHGTTVSYLETGRQALASAEGVLRREGRRRLLVPAFFCDSMMLPFVRQGWDIVPVPVGTDLFPLPSAVTAALAQPREAVVLHAPYFGQDTPQRLAEELVAARWEGARVVVDETHRLFAPSGVDADFAVASLRKTLPLADGAYVVGLDAAASAPAIGELSEASRIRAGAMAAKRRHLAGEHGHDVHLALFRQADELLADRLAGGAMSQDSRTLLRQLDYAEMARRRRSNALALGTALTEQGVGLLVDPRGSAVVLSHLVVVVPQPRALQTALAAQGIYCPLHWDRPALVEVSRWPDRLLSIPVDQRYDTFDMTRVAETLAGLPPALYRFPDTETL